MPSLDLAIAINADLLGVDIAAARASTKLGLLDSALAAPLAGFGDVDLYPHDHQRLGVLCARVIRNHPFVDGNKRSGFLLMLEAAAVNGVRLEFHDSLATADVVLALAAGELDEEDFSDFVRRHIR